MQQLPQVGDQEGESEGRWEKSARCIGALPAEGVLDLVAVARGDQHMWEVRPELSRPAVESLKDSAALVLFNMTFDQKGLTYRLGLSNSPCQPTACTQQ